MRTSDVLDQIEGALDDWETSPDAMRSGADPEAVDPPWRPPSNFAIVAVDLEPFIQAARRAAESLAVALHDHAEPFRRAFDALSAAYAEPPRNGPEPLCIDGHAYHRKRRARKRRP